VPLGAAGFNVTAAVDNEVELALFRAPAPTASDDRVALRLPPDGALPEAVATSDAGTALLEVRDNPVGRWILRVRPLGDSVAEVAIEVDVDTEDGAEPRLATGLYAPASRPGEGLIVDRAGDDWAAVWYAFDDSGASTWLYLQGAKPGVGEAWTPTVYRSALRASGQRLAVVGRASLATIDGDGPVLSFEIEGRVGSQRLLDFGRGCPVHEGVPRDLSGLWYDPELVGEGYGVWITPGYEFYGLFSHDARGQPRYLSAEGGGFNALGSRQFPLVAYRNACIFCPRGERMGEVVGEFERSFAPSLSPILARAEATFGAGVQGGRSRRDVLERLGGTTAGFGCPGQ
jgi:hypothetical protein